MKGVFVGYAENSKTYRILNLDSNVIVESRDIEFIENKFHNDFVHEPMNSSSQGNDSSIDINFESTYSNKKKLDSSSEIRRSQRVRKEKRLHPDFISSQAIVFLVKGNRSVVLNKISILLNIEDDPKTFQEAMTSRDIAFWKEVINDEIDSLLFDNTWVLVDLPPGSEPICHTLPLYKA